MLRKSDGDLGAQSERSALRRARRSARSVPRYALVAIGFVASACEPDRKPPSGSGPAADLSADPDREAKEQIHSAARCGECHAGIAAEWQTSAHATASLKDTYLAMRKDPLAQGCDRCHSPFADKLPPSAQAA